MEKPLLILALPIVLLFILQPLIMASAPQPGFVRVSGFVGGQPRVNVVVSASLPGGLMVNGSQTVVINDSRIAAEALISYSGERVPGIGVAQIRYNASTSQAPGGSVRLSARVLGEAVLPLGTVGIRGSLEARLIPRGNETIITYNITGSNGETASTLQGLMERLVLHPLLARITSLNRTVSGGETIMYGRAVAPRTSLRLRADGYLKAVITLSTARLVEANVSYRAVIMYPWNASAAASMIVEEGINGYKGYEGLRKWLAPITAGPAALGTDKQALNTYSVAASMILQGACMVNTTTRYMRRSVETLVEAEPMGNNTSRTLLSAAIAVLGYSPRSVEALLQALDNVSATMKADPGRAAEEIKEILGSPAYPYPAQIYVSNASSLTINVPGKQAERITETIKEYAALLGDNVSVEARGNTITITPYPEPATIVAATLALEGILEPPAPRQATTTTTTATSTAATIKTTTTTQVEKTMAGKTSTTTHPVQGIPAEEKTASKNPASTPSSTSETTIQTTTNTPPSTIRTTTRNSTVSPGTVAAILAGGATAVIIGYIIWRTIKPPKP